MRKSIVRGHVVFVAALALYSLAVPAGAVLFQNTTGLASPDSTITFSEFGIVADTVITNQYSGLGVTFGPNVYQNPQAFPDFNIDSSPDSISNFSFSGGPTVFPFSIFFTSDRNEAAFAMITNTGMSLFEALLGGVVVDSGSLPTTTFSALNFYGFSGVTFDEIRVTPGGGNNSMILDNLQLGAAVPEPSGLYLMLVGTAVALLGRRLHRSRKA